MRYTRWIYVACLVGLAALYALSFETGGYRLPRYYMPDGDIIPIGFTGESARFVEIAGQDPSATRAIFPEPGAVMVRTNRGAGLMELTPNDRIQTAQHFKFIILFSLIYLLMGVYFLQSGNDIHLSALCLCLAVFNYSLIMTLAYHRFEYLWFLSGITLPAFLLNAGLRTTGKEVTGYLLVGELILAAFLALVAYVGRESAETLRNLEILGVYLFFTALFVTLALQLDNALKRADDRIERFKRWALFAGFVAGLTIPMILVQMSLLWRDLGIPLDALMLAGLLFPPALIYSTYRLHIIPFQFVLTRSIIAALVTIFLVVIYGLALLLHSLLLPEQESRYQWIVNLTFILILVFFLDPMRRRIQSWVERNILRLDPALSESLKRIAALVSAHSRIQPTTHAFLNELRETLGLERALFLFSTPPIPALNLRSDIAMRISPRNGVWRFLEADRLVVTSYLTYAGGGREELFNFLYKHRVMLALGVLGGRSGPFSGAGYLTEEQLSLIDAELREEFQPGDSVKAALLVGYRRDGKKLELKEIRYLQDAARLAGMLIYNYALLLQEIGKRRRIRNLTLAGQMQRQHFKPMEFETTDVRIGRFSRPAVTVTGDYLDMFPLPARRLAVFVGDVTGHGLGTGYLVSSIQSIVRSHLEAGASLVETIQTLNLFLMERYQGNEFITLFACILKLDTGDMEYINAAHPAPVLMRASGEEQLLKSNQRLVGILPTPYFSNRLRLDAGDRLHVYSDGVTETFNLKDEAYGEPRLLRFLQGTREMPVQEIANLLELGLREFRGSDVQTDDTTFITLEYAGRPGPVRGIMNLLGLEGR